MLRLVKKDAPHSDIELIELYKSTSDKKYVGYLFTKYSHLVLGMSLSYLKSEDKAKDAVMDIFEKLFIDLKNYEINNFSAWLFSVIRNYCLMKMRSEKIKEPYEFYDQEEDNFMESGEILHLIEGDNHSPELLNECILELKKDQQECIEKFYFENKSYKDISMIKSIDIKAVKSNIQNGKRNLRILLENKLRKR